MCLISSSLWGCLGGGKRKGPSRRCRGLIFPFGEKQALRGILVVLGRTLRGLLEVGNCAVAGSLALFHHTTTVAHHPLAPHVGRCISRRLPPNPRRGLTT